MTDASPPQPPARQSEVPYATYDPEAKALYITVSDPVGSIRSVERDGLIFDYVGERLCGIEVVLLTEPLIALPQGTTGNHPSVTVWGGSGFTSR